MGGSPLRVVRLFVAVELAGSGATRGDAPTHLTLKFLGEADPVQVATISSAVADAVRPASPYELVLEGVGAFPSRARPRVVWVGVARGREATIELARKVSDALAPLGFPVEREQFVPHVTLFRVRTPDQHRRALALLAGEEAPPPPRTFVVEEVVLKESTLTARGAVHQTQGRFPLAGSPSVGPVG